MDQYFYLDCLYVFQSQLVYYFTFYVFIKWLFCFWDFQCKIGTNIDKKVMKGFYNKLFLLDGN